MEDLNRNGGRFIKEAKVGDIVTLCSLNGKSAFRLPYKVAVLYLVVDM